MILMLRMYSIMRYLKFPGLASSGLQGKIVQLAKSRQIQYHIPKSVQAYKM